MAAYQLFKDGVAFGQKSFGNGVGGHGKYLEVELEKQKMRFPESEIEWRVV